MSSRQRLPGSAIALIAGAFTFGAAEADASAGNLFLYSPVGPGQGESVFGVGGRVYLFIPTFDLHYVRGLTDYLDLYFDLNSLVVINQVDLGLRARLVGDASSRFSMALKAAANPTFLFLKFRDAEPVSFAATPGIVFGFGGPTTQFTVGFDLPIYFGSAGFAAGESGAPPGSKVQLVGRPNIGVEWRVGDSANMYIQASSLIGFSDSVSDFVGPIVGIGAAG
ncbi:MAG: hypothetical protein HY791_39630 [Deltaproteobacteria bacterium]|nr:hypothetical protein [Deltaproteobacteria bacterium]